MADGGRPPVQLEVPVAPVGGGGRSRRTGGVALLGVVLLGAIVAAVGLAQAFPAEPRSTSVVPAVSPVAREPGPASPTPFAGRVTPPPVVVAAPRRLDRTALTDGVRDGSLDGWLVYADADLVDPCAGAAASCTGNPSIAGLALPVDGAREEMDAGGPPDAAILVLRVDGGHLAYLGSLIVHLDGSPSLATLSDELAAGLNPASTLFDARGWLVLRPPCIAPAPEATCAPVPAFLADDEPEPDGIVRSDRGEDVAIAPDPWGFTPNDTVRGGPFLVRLTGGDPRWQVVARYDPSRSVRVVIP